LELDVNSIVACVVKFKQNFVGHFFVFYHIVKKFE